MNQDDEHLRLLSIFHYVVGGLSGLCAMFPIIHLIAGLFIVFAPEEFANKGQPPPVFLGWLFVTFAVAFIVLGWVCAVLVIMAGRCLARRKRRTFCLVMAGIECFFAPFGTVLGVFTIVVLMRESVKQLFEANSPAQPAAGTAAVE